MALRHNRLWPRRSRQTESLFFAAKTPRKYPKPKTRFPSRHLPQQSHEAPSLLPSVPQCFAGNRYPSATNSLDPQLLCCEAKVQTKVSCHLCLTFLLSINPFPLIDCLARREIKYRTNARHLYQGCRRAIEPFLEAISQYPKRRTSSGVSSGLLTVTTPNLHLNQ